MGGYHCVPKYSWYLKYVQSDTGGLDLDELMRPYHLLFLDGPGTQTIQANVPV